MAANKAYNPMDEKVTVFIPYTSGEDPSIFVGLNGKGWNIPRGKECQVPKPVADILYKSEAAKLAAKAYSDEQQRLMRETLKDPVY